jgi:hypothetical protein
MALYLRDALELPVDTRPALPGLDPAVAVGVPAGVDPHAVAAEWPGWWAEILQWCADPPRGRAGFESLPVIETSPALAGRPAVQAALAALTETAARYHATLPRPPVPPRGRWINEVVTGLERELGRRAKPFRLAITEIRVRGAVWAPLTGEHVLASTSFLESDAARPALREALLPVA